MDRARVFRFLSERASAGETVEADSEERALFARSWPVGTTALWIAILLSAYVLIYYL